MSLENSGRIVTDGLVFIYDAENPKSYKGPTMTNLLTSSISPYNTSGTGYDFIGGTEEVYIPTLGKTSAKFCKIQNNYSAVSTWCCPAPFGLGGGFAVSPSTLYTYLILYKVNSGYTNANYMYRYEYNSGTYVTEAGVHSEARRVHLGDGWYYAWGTFTTNASTNTITSCASFYYRYSTSYDKMYVAKACMVQGDYSGMHPRYWPDGQTTRSNTQAILDLAGNNTITASSLTYSSDGSFSFNNTNDVIETSFPAQTLNNSTICAWVYDNTADTNYRAIVQNNTASDDALYVNPSNYLMWWPATASTLTVPRNQWTFVAASHTYGSGILYQVNSTQQFVSGTFSDPTDWDFLRIGGHSTGDSERWGGKIPVVNVYNRALTAAEVQQNFNALRGRYGI